MRKIAALISALLLLAACGSDVDGASETVTIEPSAVAVEATESPVEETDASAETDEPQAEEAVASESVDRPVAIVSMSPTATEMLFLIGAGSQVIAVDNYSYWPLALPW